MIEFSVVDWSAWAPGLTGRADWEAWAHAPHLPTGDGAPSLAEVPPMQRRRIERLGRLAIQVACWCEGAGGHADDVPLVFASRHGDVERSVQLLQAVASDQPMSPTAFGLSVHNAIAALYSITRGHRGNYLALSAGRSTVEAACLEAVGLLADGASEVVIVVYEASLADIYREFADEPDTFFAWSWRVSRATDGGIRLALDWGDAADQVDTPAGHLPQALDLHRFLLAGDRALQRVAHGQRWQWTRHG